MITLEIPHIEGWGFVSILGAVSVGLLTWFFARDLLLKLNVSKKLAITLSSIVFIAVFFVSALYLDQGLHDYLFGFTYDVMLEIIIPE